MWKAMVTPRRISSCSMSVGCITITGSAVLPSSGGDTTGASVVSAGSDVGPAVGAEVVAMFVDGTAVEDAGLEEVDAFVDIGDGGDNVVGASVTGGVISRVGVTPTCFVEVNSALVLVTFPSDAVAVCSWEAVGVGGGMQFGKTPSSTHVVQLV